MNEIITYTLKIDRETSDEYYANIRKFTDEILTFSVSVVGHIVEEYEKHVIQKGIEGLRSREEYILELVMLGVFWNIYKANAIRVKKIPRELLKKLSYIRRRGGALKKLIDFIKGIFMTLFLMKPNNSINTDADLTFDNYKKLIEWLKASGEYEEELDKLQGWKRYFSEEDEDKSFSNLLLIQSLGFSFLEKSNKELRCYIPNVKDYISYASNKHKWREDIIFCTQDCGIYYLNMVGAEIMNREFRNEFLRAKRKIVLLPVCMRLRSFKECRAKKTDEGYKCMNCTKNCRVSYISKLGINCGFETYMIHHESDAFANIPISKEEIGVVGVSCLTNLIAGGWKAKALNVSPQCVILDYCGCSTHWHEKGIVTDINLKKFLEVLELEDIDRELTV